jgi:hypothetical protein
MKWFGKCRRKESGIVIRYGKYGSEISRIVKCLENMDEKYVEQWKDMKNME